MRGKNALIVLLVAVLALAGVGCVGGNKTTGGGWFTDVWTGHKITFGFNARPTGEVSTTTPQGQVGAKGQFQLFDHDSNIRIKGTFTSTYEVSSNATSQFFGMCSIEDEGDVPFFVICVDNGEPGFGSRDLIEIHI